MPSRVQQLVLGLGVDAQADIVTPSTVFHRFKKIDTSITSPKPVFENDAAEIGKGNEFIGQTFGSHYEVANKLEKYASSEFCAWAWAFALGLVTEATGTYTIKPIDPGLTLELPYFSVVEQIAEGGGSALDNIFIGCAIEEVSYQFSYGPGRASSKMNVSWLGTGKLTTPSAVVVPALVAEHYMLAAGMTLVVNGVDYVAGGRTLSGTISWKNNLMANAGYFPGSGTQNGLQIRGRLEIGARVPTFQFTVRLLKDSPEYAALVAQTTGTASVGISFDGTNAITFNFPRVALEAVDVTEVDGIVAIQVTVAPEFDATSGTVMSVTAKTTLTGIAQAAA